MKINVLNSPRLLELKKQRNKIFFNKFLLYIFAFLIIFAGLVYISRMPAFNISSVEIIGNETVDADIIKAVVAQETSGNYLWFFPKKNILFYPKNNITKELQNRFKRFKNINFSIKDNKILEIVLTERIAVYTWCGDTYLAVGLPSDNPTTKEEKCYFVDDAGFIFDEAPYFSAGVYFRFYGIADRSYFSPKNFTSLISFKEALLVMGLKPVTLYIEENGNAKILLSSRTLSIGPEIIFKIDSDLSIVAKNLETVVNTEPLLSDLKNKYSSLLYIDLRFGNKVYYKFR
ncbi:hypothetical protein EXS45_00195 [Candidatus Nomurabacteria bacterium]|nr:hypothetical protein [Candidatus Nomurabacteria bacterium]